MKRHAWQVTDLRNNGLGEFMRSRRAALSPEQSGVPVYGNARRVPGLRREEVALLAGLSVNYYTRLEQGENHQMSDSVLDAIARALQLDDNERLHLTRLAWPSQFSRRHFGPETVRPSLRALVEGNSEQAVGILGRQLHMLGGNRLFHALFGVRPGQVVNSVLRMFLDPAMRDFYADWENEAAGKASFLRMATGEHPDDQEFAAIIGELTIKSPDFVRIWSRQPVAEWVNGFHVYNHPEVGRLALTRESLRVPDAGGQLVNFWSAVDADSADRLSLLALS